MEGINTRFVERARFIQDELFKLVEAIHPQYQDKGLWKRHSFLVMDDKIIFYFTDIYTLDTGRNTPKASASLPRPVSFYVKGKAVRL